MADPSRRSVLAGAVLALAAVGGGALGLTRHVHHRVAIPPAPPPAALTQAASAAANLLAGFDACLAAGASSALLNPLRAETADHRAALLAVLQNYPGWRLEQAGPLVSASGQPGQSQEPAVTTVAALRAQVSAQQDTLARVCVAWPAAEAQASTVVPLLGSICACLGVHAKLLS